MSPRRKRTVEGAHEPMAMTIGGTRSGRRANVRLAIVLAIVAAAFYFGILVLKHP